MDKSVLANEAVTHFSSMTELRDTHSDLLNRHHRDGNTPEVMADIETFIQNGQATGMLLYPDDEDRWEAQSLLDYWTTILYRAGRELPTVILAEFDKALVPSLDNYRCPYRGLDAFREEDSEQFFGREGLIKDMLAKLKDDRFLVVVGASGIGKSSAVRAGLIPELKAGKVPGSEQWHYLKPIVPGSDPLKNLARGLWRTQKDLGGEWVSEQIEGLQINPTHLTQLVETLFGGPVVLVIDQFEEVFTLCTDPARQQQFIANLLHFIAAEEHAHRLIITLRTDFEDQVPRFRDFYKRYEQARVEVRPPSWSELREAIEGPAKSLKLKPEASIGGREADSSPVELKFAPGLVDRLIGEVVGQPATLPLLQFTLLKLWDQKAQNRITREIYEDLGGALKVLGKSATVCYNKLEEEKYQEIAKHILLHMIRPDKGSKLTSRRIRRETLYSLEGNNEDIDFVLDQLRDAGLILITKGDTPDDDQDDQVEVAHEALVQNWDLLEGWLNNERKHMEFRKQLDGKVEEWLGRNRRSGLLDREALEEAKQYRDNAAKYLGHHEALPALIAASQTALNWRKLIYYGLPILLVVLSGIFGVVSYLAAKEQRVLEIDKAESQKVQQALSDLLSDPELSLLLAMEVVGTNPTIPAIDALYQAFQALQKQATRRSLINDVTDLAFDSEGRWLATADDGAVQLRVLDTGRQETQFALEDEAEVLAFDPAGNWLATESDGTVQLRVLDTGRQETQFALEGKVSIIAFSPDGSQVALGTDDGTVRVWNTQTGTEFKLEKRIEPMTDLVFHPILETNQLITVGGADRIAEFWDVKTGKEISFLPTKDRTDIHILAFSPDGRWLATGSNDGIVKLWNTVNGIPKSRHILILRREDTEGIDSPVKINDLTFDPAGLRLATASDDNKAILWDVASGRREMEVGYHTSSVEAVRFSPDGTMVATLTENDIVQLWRVTAYDARMILSGHDGSAYAVAFSPDGRTLATLGEDATRLWAVGPDGNREQIAVLDGTTGFSFGLDFSPDGKQLAVSRGSERGGERGGERGLFSVWDVSSPLSATQVFSQSIPGRTVLDVAFSPDGDLLATSDGDYLRLSGSIVRLWQKSDEPWAKIVHLPIPEGIVYDLAFSPAGDILAIGTGDFSNDRGTVRLMAVHRNGDTDEPLSKIVTMPMNSPILFLAFSPDGNTLATSRLDNTVQLWDVSTTPESGDRPSRKAVLRGYADIATGLAFSPDSGKQLATVSQDRTVRLWDVEKALTSGGSGAMVAEMHGHEGLIFDVAYHPGSDMLATADQDGTVRIWPLNINELVQLACNRATRNLTLIEWEEYFGEDISYRKTCEALPEPLEGEVILAQAQKYLDQGNHDQARTALREATALDPAIEREAAQLYIDLGQAYLYEENLNDALDAFKEAVKFDPEIKPIATQALIKHGQAYVYQGATEAALTALQQVAEFDPTLELDPKAEVRNMLIELGHRYRYQGTYTEAENVLQQGVEFSLADAQLHIERARIYLYQGADEEALTALQQAAEFNPTLNPEAEAARMLIEQGRTYLSQGAYTDTKGVLQRAVELDPAVAVGAADLYTELARTYFDQGADEEALAALQQAAKFNPTLNPEVESAGMLRDRARSYLDEGAVEEALTALQQAGELAPALDPEVEAAWILIDQGRTYLYQGAYDDALTALQQAAAFVPEDEQTQRSELALIYNGICWQGSPAGQVEIVFPACERAVALEPENGGYRDSRGLARALTGDYEGAIADFQYYVEWGQDIRPEWMLERRRAWIQQLEAGQNPFDAATLAELQYESAPVEPILSEAQLAVEAGKRLLSQGAYADAWTSLQRATDLDSAYETIWVSDLTDLYNEICRQAGSAGLIEQALPACQEAVDLALGFNDRFMSYKICLNQSIEGLADVVSSTCDRVEGQANAISFAEPIAGVVEPDGHYFWVFVGTAEQIIKIQMDKETDDLDPYVTLLGPDGATLIEDDDQGGDYNALIDRFTLPETGTYTIVARGFRDMSVGAYRLMLSEVTE